MLYLKQVFKKSMVAIVQNNYQKTVFESDQLVEINNS